MIFLPVYSIATSKYPIVCRKLQWWCWRWDSWDLVYAYIISAMDLSVSMHLSSTCHFNHCYLLVTQLLLLFFLKVHVVSRFTDTLLTSSNYLLWPWVLICPVISVISIWPYGRGILPYYDQEKSQKCSRFVMPVGEKLISLSSKFVRISG